MSWAMMLGMVIGVVLLSRFPMNSKLSLFDAVLNFALGVDTTELKSSLAVVRSAVLALVLPG